jgi:hypothetical protein
MITIRVSIMHDEDTQGEPREVTTESMVERATDINGLATVVMQTADSAVNMFTAIDRIADPLPLRTIKDQPQA